MLYPKKTKNPNPSPIGNRFGFFLFGGAPNSNATKIWITKAGGCYLCNNNSQIPPRVLRNIMAVIEARSGEVIEKWTAFFGEIRYFC